MRKCTQCDVVFLPAYQKQHNCSMSCQRQWHSMRIKAALAKTKKRKGRPPVYNRVPDVVFLMSSYAAAQVLGVDHKTISRMKAMPESYGGRPRNSLDSDSDIAHT